MNTLIIATSLLCLIKGLTAVPTPSPINSALSRCVSTDTPLDIIFIVDSSSSVFDDEYNNWQYQLDLVYNIVDNAIPLNSRVGLINFSGCGPSFNEIQCLQQGKLQSMIHLSTYGSPNDLDDVLSTIDTFDGDDFLGGYTWTNEALQLALDEFNSNPSTVEDTNKMIVLITDGAPYPSDGGHEPCKTSTGYVSTTLQSLRELDVAIMTVGIDIDIDDKEEYFDCINGQESYFQGSFDTTTTDEDLAGSIGDFICSKLGSSRRLIPITTPSPTERDPCIPQQSQGSELDIVFMVDSSGSVFDPEFINWQSQLDLVYDIINNSLDVTPSRASLINFSGCPTGFTLAQCIAQGRLNTVFNLTTYGNDIDMTLARVKQMSSDDFNGGSTWTNEALGLALDQFNSYSTADKAKVIVLLTDGEPFPYDEGHEPCLTSTGYQSDILIALKELGVYIISIGVDIDEDVKDEKLACVSNQYFGVSQFKTLSVLSDFIGVLICSNVYPFFGFCLLC